MLRNAFLMSSMSLVLFVALTQTSYADVLVTDTAGAPADGFSMASSNFKMTSSTGTLFCNTVSMSGYADSGADATISEIAGNGSNDGALSECPVLNTDGSLFTAGTITQIFGTMTLQTDNTGLLFLDINYDITVAPGVEIKCFFNLGYETISYTTGPPAVVSVSNAPLTGSGKGCPSIGALDADITMDVGIDD